MVFHSFQANQFDRGIRDGVIYPRWIPDANNGYGSPNFIFYSPLSYYLVSITGLFTRSLTTAMIIVIWVGFFLSGVTMFITTKKMFGGSGNPLPAIIYQILPFHLGDLYIRGTFAELFAFVWFPLIILFMHETIESRNKMAMVGLSISYAGLILTHLVSAYIISIVAGVYFIYNFFLLKDRKPIIKTLFSLALGLGMSAIYLLPVIFDRRFVRIDYLLKCSICDYRNNFLFTFDKFQGGLRSFYLPIHIEVVLEVTLSILTILLIRKKRQGLSDTSQQNFFVFLLVFACFLTTPLSKPIWNLIPGFPFLQFPWRWVTVIELSLCLLTATLFSLKGMSAFRLTDLKKRLFVYVIITLSLVSLNIILKGSHLISKIATTTVNAREYTPIWAGDIKKITSATPMGRVSVVSGEALSDITEWKSEERAINIKASTPAVLRISTFYYPGWQARIDGHKTEIMIEKRNGAMLIDIPEGRHKLALEFEDTPLRYYARIISLVSLCAIVLLVLFSKKSSRNLTSPI